MGCLNRSSLFYLSKHPKRSEFNKRMRLRIHGQKQLLSDIYMQALQLTNPRYLLFQESDTHPIFINCMMPLYLPPDPEPYRLVWQRVKQFLVWSHYCLTPCSVEWQRPLWEAYLSPPYSPLLYYRCFMQHSMA